MIVYGDLLFLINFSMDFLCFYLSCLILHKRLPTVRACIASALGGVYSVASLFLFVNGTLSLVTDVLVLILICLIVYAKGGMTPRRIAGATALYFFVSALLGGIMTALFSLFNRLDFLADKLSLEEGLDVWIFALLALVSCAVTLRGGRGLRSSLSRRDAELIIEDEGGVVRLRALVDSGNLTVEPISGKKVIFADLSACSRALDGDVRDYLMSGREMDEIPPSLTRRIRFVPSRTVGGSMLLPALRMRNTELISGRQRKKLDVYIALVPPRTFNEYGAIIPSELII